MPKGKPKAPQTNTSNESTGVNLSQEQFDALMNRLNALENQANGSTQPDVQVTTQTSTRAPLDADRRMPATTAPQMTTSGQAVGILYQYPIEAAYYPDPREDLMDLPELTRFAMRHNYLLDWDVAGKTIETKWGSVIGFPIFTLTLWRQQFDQDGNPTSAKIRANRGVFSEDEIATKKQAEKLGLDMENMDMRQLMDRVRFERMKKWLIDFFIHPDPRISRGKTTFETVIDGKVVTIEDTERLL